MLLMADKDIAQGWGDLPGSLTSWHCPKCKKDYPVSEWAIIQSVSGTKMDGRKCPHCDFSAFQHHETIKMHPPTPKAKVKS